MLETQLGCHEAQRSMRVLNSLFVGYMLARWIVVLSSNVDYFCEVASFDIQTLIDYFLLLVLHIHLSPKNPQSFLILWLKMPVCIVV